MKKAILVFLLFMAARLWLFGGLKPGDKAVGFALLSVDSSMVSLSDYLDQKGLILVFTNVPCPFSKAYEQRIIDLHNTYANLGFPVVAINSNNPDMSPQDSFEHMQLRARKMAYPFPYLKDSTEEVCRAYGATRTPQIFLLERSGNGFTVAYLGAIDDNSLDARSVSNRYLENAIRALTLGERPEPATTRAIGCLLKIKDR
ncbi:MAG: thioredoxin family protein [Bacteroidales bacterium]|nr:thioredoxin family protein [Bacteroidales bacterium]